MASEAIGSALNTGLAPPAERLRQDGTAADIVTSRHAFDAIAAAEQRVAEQKVVLNAEARVRAFRSPQASLVRAAERRGNIPSDAVQKMLSHPAMEVFEEAHQLGVKLPESQKQLKRGLRKDSFGTLPTCAEEILLADALILGKTKIVSAGVDRERVDNVLADLDNAIDRDMEQHRVRHRTETEMSMATNQEIIENAIRSGMQQASNRLQRLNVQAGDTHQDFLEQLNQLTAEQRLELIEEGQAATLRAHTRMELEPDLAATDLPRFAALVQDLEANPWDKGEIRTQVMREVEAETWNMLDVDYEHVLMTVTHELPPLHLGAAARVLAEHREMDELQAAEQRVNARPVETLAVEDQLEHLEFTQRVAELREAGRINYDTESVLMNMAQESTDLDEFKNRMHFDGRVLMGATEYRYLDSALNTPEGRRPETWQESAAYVRAFGAGEPLSPQRMEQMHQEQHIEQVRTIG